MCSGSNASFLTSLPGLCILPSNTSSNLGFHLKLIDHSREPTASYSWVSSHGLHERRPTFTTPPCRDPRFNIRSPRRPPTHLLSVTTQHLFESVHNRRPPSIRNNPAILIYCVNSTRDRLSNTTLFVGKELPTTNLKTSSGLHRPPTTTPLTRRHRPLSSLPHHILPRRQQPSSSR